MTDAPAPLAAPTLAAWAQRYDAWLADAALPLWAGAGMDRDHGGAHELMAMDGRPVDGAHKRARVQARQAFVFATAAQGRAGPWLDAAQHAWRFLLEIYRRPDGLLRTTVDARGAPVDEDAYLYDQAFALMAAATLHRTAPGLVDAQGFAEDLRGRLYALMRAPGGRGFREAGSRPFQANAHMHLFEAALAWMEAGGDPQWTALAEELAALALDRFIDPQGGFLREAFDEAWNPAPGAEGLSVEPGHQFEWTWLLTRWARLRGSHGAATAAQRLFAAGCLGMDPARDAAVDETEAPDMGVRKSGARLWPQTEAIKAALILREEAEPEARAALEAFATRSAAALWRYLDVETVGLWRDKQAPDRCFADEPAPASSFYHILGAVMALRGAAAA